MDLIILMLLLFSRCYILEDFIDLVIVQPATSL